MTFAEVMTNAGTIVTTIASTTASLLTTEGLGFIALPIAFIYGRKLLGGAKGLLGYARSKRR